MKKIFKRTSGIVVGLLGALHLSAFAAPPTVNLATTPLYSGGGNVRPNLLLDLSVEFPTVKAAYTNSNDYNKQIEYIGYFNTKKMLFEWHFQNVHEG